MAEHLDDDPEYAQWWIMNFKDTGRERKEGRFLQWWRRRRCDHWWEDRNEHPNEEWQVCTRCGMERDV